MTTTFYTIKTGDNLNKISFMFFGSTNRVNDIAILNNIKDVNKISVGQVLKLPTAGQIHIPEKNEIYTISRGDTLASISTRFFGNASFAKLIADTNGIRNKHLIFIGQQIEIPSKGQVDSPIMNDEPSPHLLKVPHGLDEILTTFGDIYRFIDNSGNINPNWTRIHFDFLNLPFSMPLSWNPSQKATRFICNKRLIKIFENVFNEIKTKNLDSKINSFGGVYNFRRKSRNGALSTHSWGIAIDLNPLTNALGTKGNMDQNIISIFRKHGFKWGGDWNGKNSDPMHFQYCTGY